MYLQNCWIYRSAWVLTQFRLLALPRSSG
jgi:hypothetical protein